MSTLKMLSEKDNQDHHIDDHFLKIMFY